MSVVPVNPPGPVYPAFSQAVQTGPWLTISGQLALKDGELVSHDALEQARQCFANLEEILVAANLGFGDVVKLTCYLTSADAYPAYAEVKRKVLGDTAPAGTAVIVSGFLVPGALMEIEASAWRQPV